MRDLGCLKSTNERPLWNTRKRQSTRPRPFSVCLFKGTHAVADLGAWAHSDSSTSFFLMAHFLIERQTGLLALMAGVRPSVISVLFR